VERPDRQCEIDGQGVLYVQHNVGFDDRFETDSGNLHSIRARRQVGQDVNAFTVGFCGVLHCGYVIHSHDLCPDDRCTGRIRDQAVNVPVGGLREQVKRAQREENVQRNRTGEAHVGSPASNGFPTTPPLIRRTIRSGIS
jgi:hypothetical protein